jgi:hypothetical protein
MRPASTAIPLFIALFLAMPVFAEDVPLPRPRPAEADLKQALPIEIDPQEIEAAKKVCEDFFKADVAVATPENPMAWDNGCSAAAPVRITAFKLKDGKTVELRPSAILRCTTALTIGNWIRDDLSPAAEKLGTRIERIDVAASFGCRPRNSIFGAIMSEHGKANAFDIRSLHLADGRTVTIENTVGPPAFFTEMRKSACVRFMTVLGPGSDKSHENHLHVDLAERRGGYKMCQWILPKPEKTTSQHEQAAQTEEKDAGKKVEKIK